MINSATISGYKIVNLKTKEKRDKFLKTMLFKNLSPLVNNPKRFRPKGDILGLKFYALLSNAIAEVSRFGPSMPRNDGA